MWLNVKVIASSKIHMIPYAYKLKFTCKTDINTLVLCLNFMCIVAQYYLLICSCIHHTIACV